MNLENLSKPRCLWALLLMVVFICAASGLPSLAEEPLPDLIWATDGIERSYPFFVSAERALTPEGELNAELLSEGSRLTIERDILAGDFSDCKGGYLHLTGGDPRSHWVDFRSILADSGHVVIGRVTGSRNGFWKSDPGTLFRIVPERWIGPADDWSEKYLFVPTVDMEFAGKRVCFRNERYPQPPQIGWSVLIAYADTHTNRKNALFFVDPARIIVIPPKGAVALPKFLEERQAGWKGKSGAEVVREIEKMSRKGEKP